MEDDDEFGDLYTDVLRPLTTSSAPAQSTAATSSSRPIDLNTIHSDDDDGIIYGAAAPVTNSNLSNFKISLSGQQTLAQDPFSSDLGRNSIKVLEKEGNSAGTGSRVLDKGFEDPNFMDESGIDIIVEERDHDKDVNSENFGGNTGIDINNNNFGNLQPVIPGLSMPRVSENGSQGEGDDWDDDSDSEDDLQIVLNDNTGITGMERGGEEDDGEDEDGDNLVILADTDPNHHQPMEEQDWGEDAAQGAAEGGGERKDLGDSTAKINGAAVAPPKIGYSGFHHPFHSQFKVSHNCTCGVVS